MSNAQVLAENHGDDLGYPWFDVGTGELVLVCGTPRGRQLLDGAGITVPFRIRSVVHGAAELSGSRTTRHSCVRRACPVPS